MKLIIHILKKGHFLKNIVLFVSSLIYALLVFAPFLLIIFKLNIKNRLEDYLNQYLYVLFLIEIISIKEKSINNFIAELKNDSTYYILKPLNIAKYALLNKLNIKNIIMIIFIMAISYMINSAFFLKFLIFSIYSFLIIDVICKFQLISYIYFFNKINLLSFIKKIMYLFRIPIEFYGIIGISIISIVNKLQNILSLKEYYLNISLLMITITFVYLGWLLETIINKSIFSLYKKTI
jgi:hypothetical protein